MLTFSILFGMKVVRYKGCVFVYYVVRMCVYSVYTHRQTELNMYGTINHILGIIFVCVFRCVAALNNARS